MPRFKGARNRFGRSEPPGSSPTRCFRSAAGGTSTLTIDSLAPAITYNSYQIYGTAGGASYVYRRYTVTNAEVAAQMTNFFPYPVAYRNSDGTSATLTSTPAGTVFYSPSGIIPLRAELHRGRVRCGERYDPHGPANGPGLQRQRRDPDAGQRLPGVRPGQYRGA